MPAKDESAAAGIEQRGGTPCAALKGLAVDELTPQLARRFGLPARTSGVVVTDVEPGTPADRAGLSRGDIIQEINRRQVTSLRDFEQLTRGLGNQPVLLLINRGGKTIFAVVQP